MALSATVSHATAADGTFSVAGAAAWDGTGAHTVTISGIASAAQGGTGIAFFTAAGPTIARTYTFPDADSTILVSGGALGTPSSGTLTNATGLPEAGLTLADNTTNDVSITKHGLAPKAPNVATQYLDGTGAWSTPAGSVTLNGIAAATGAATIASGNNTGIVWNWANTTDATTAFTLGETSAATNGTATSGIPNQVLLKLTTLAASTQSPLQVYSRAVHAFSVSASATPQILARSGAAATPTYSFAADTGSGMYLSAANVLAFNGFNSVPQLTLSYAAGEIIMNQNAGAPNSDEWRYLTGGAIQITHSSADTVSPRTNGRKSRGSVTSPTVITTGDDLLIDSGFGYLGATNTYQEATRITHDSVGTISDATTGIGGNLDFSTRKQGTDTAVAVRFRLDQFGHPISVAGTANTPTISAGGGTGPAITGTDDTFVVTIGTGGIATTVTVAFASNYPAAPCVSVESDTDIVPFKVAPAVGSVVITATAAFTAGSKLYCQARGYA